MLNSPGTNSDWLWLLCHTFLTVLYHRCSEANLLPPVEWDVTSILDLSTSVLLKATNLKNVRQRVKALKCLSRVIPRYQHAKNNIMVNFKTEQQYPEYEYWALRYSNAFMRCAYAVLWIHPIWSAKLYWVCSFLLQRQSFIWHQVLILH